MQVATVVVMVTMKILTGAKFPFYTEETSSLLNIQDLTRTNV